MNDSNRRRMALANAVIEIVATHGRKFFSQNADHRTGVDNPRLSHFIEKNNRLWFVDKYSGKEIYVCYDRGRWRGFSDGGTLRSLIQHLRDFILGKADINLRYFGPWPEWVCGGDLWGYGSEMETVRNKVTSLISSPAAIKSIDVDEMDAARKKEAH